MVNQRADRAKLFAPFAADRNVNVDWYKFPVEESVMEYDTAK